MVPSRERRKAASGEDWRWATRLWKVGQSRESGRGEEEEGMILERWWKGHDMATANEGYGGEGEVGRLWPMIEAMCNKDRRIRRVDDFIFWSQIIKYIL
mmetsp:Transcript_22923/g.48414  ORF Transcript_22923/g.48414 Transcript_22923/m.48414 type:complete len:99 (-) Transcript_22923:26-322(-)